MKWQEPVVIIACTRDKADEPASAAELYQGATFGLNLRAALAETDGDTSRVLILSARHGLVSLDTVLAPYDTTMGDADAVAVPVVRAQAEAHGLADHREVYAMVPQAYYAVLAEALEEIGTYPAPVFEGARGVGDQRHVASHCANG